jgi:predicted O-methyltransferase YrrM
MKVAVFMWRKSKMMHSHRETFMKLDELGMTYPEYHPTFDFGKAYIDSSHEFFMKCPTQDGTLIQVKNGRWGRGVEIQGWLRRADALKLYELAYFVRGDILELGSYHGLSTTILSEANQRSPYRKHIYSVDLNPQCVKQTEHNLRSKGFSRDVTTICGEATTIVKSFGVEGKKFEFVFIDHSHAYEPVYTVCRELDKVMFNGAVCLFHDFNDPRNREVQNKEYGVYQAVTEALEVSKFEFLGIYGCTALYRVI